MKKLCFGSFMTVLVKCKPKRTAQKRLCGIILLSIAPNYDIREDDDTTSGLVRGNDNLPPDITNATPKGEFKTVAEYFEKEVVPMLDPNKQSTIILALKEMIEKDDDIQPTTIVEMVNGFTKTDIVKRTSFVFADFLAGVFLYTVANVENRGNEDAVKEITDEYIQSFETLKSDISLITAYSKVDAEFAVELAVGAEEITLLAETGGKCQKCDRPLGVMKGDKPVNYAKRVRVSNSDDMLVCVECAREMHNISDEEKLQLILDKSSLEKMNTTRDSVARHTIESQIQKVLEAIHDMDVTEETQLKTEPVKIENKVTEKRLKERVLQDVTLLYDGVNNELDRLSGENKLDVDKFAKSIKRMFEDANETLSCQSDIYHMLVDTLFNKTGRKYKEACEVIISYFVQRCEVFNEIAE